MRFVVLGSLLGFVVAVGGLAFFGMGWLMALTIWLVSGPAGAILALASTLPPRDGTAATAMATGLPSRAA